MNRIIRIVCGRRVHFVNFVRTVRNLRCVCDDSGRVNLERVQMILICSMIPFAGGAFYFAHVCLSSIWDRRIFIFSLLSVCFLGLAQLIVGWIHAFKVLRNPHPLGKGCFKQLLVYDLTVLAIMLSTMFTPVMLRRNTAKIWERMKREEFNKRKNNPPRYQPLESRSFAWVSDGDFRSRAS